MDIIRALIVVASIIAFISIMLLVDRLIGYIEKKRPRDLVDYMEKFNKAWDDEITWFKDTFRDREIKRRKK